MNPTAHRRLARVDFTDTMSSSAEHISQRNQNRALGCWDHPDTSVRQSPPKFSEPPDIAEQHTEMRHEHRI